MKSFIRSLTGIVVLALSLSTAAPQVDQPAGPAVSSIADVNPFLQHQPFNSPVYREKVILAAADIAKRLDFGLAIKALKVAAVPTFLWVSDTAGIDNIEGWLREATLVEAVTGNKQVVQMVVYNLPDRDCSAKASAGELELSRNGEALYRAFVRRVREELEKFPDIRVVIQLETDAIGNFVTNQSNEKCANAFEAQKRSYAFAIATLQLPNVALYIDGAHDGWLGWESNIGPAADVMIELIELAKEINPNTKVRGVATNVSNYNGLGNQEQAGRDELKYVRNLGPLLAEKGWEAHFIVDQGRSGNQEAPREGGDWCNFASAGFGPRPTTDTPDPLIDAIVWVKPGGEGDGTSDTSAVRYDEACGSETSLKPAPEAGAWFQAYFEQLIRNADPPF